MIKITNGTDNFIIPDDKLRNRQKGRKGIVTKLKYGYWGIELLFITNRKNTYKKIIKTYREGESDLKEYKNLSQHCVDEITLSDNDYAEVKKLYENMHINRAYKKEALIKSCAIMLSYECYQNYILELDMEVNIVHIFNDFICSTSTDYREYKKEIFAMAQEILKQEYKVKLDDKLFDGGNCNE